MKFVALLFLSCLASLSAAQDLSVKSFVFAEKDLSARTSSRVDVNGKDCALVKVRLAKDGAQFKGMIAGDVEYTTSEYRVYMSQGAKRLTVLVAGYLPLDISFSDYNVEKLEAKATYLLTLELPRIVATGKLRQTKISVAPADAYITIDKLQFVADDGLLSIPLAVGEHNYSIQAPGYIGKTGSFLLQDNEEEQYIEFSLVKSSEGDVIGSGYNIMLQNIETSIGQWKLKDAKASLDYLESHVGNSESITRSKINSLRGKLNSKVDEGKPLLIANIKKNKGKLDKDGQKLLDELLAIRPDDYWLNIIKNK